MSPSPEADPSGFLERAPALASLLPDEALAEALARGDASGLYRVLAARLAVEPTGPSRDTLAGLVADRALFAMAEPPPSVRSVLGTGTGFTGSPPRGDAQASFVATRVVRLLGVPVWPLGEHLARRGRDGALQVLGGLPRSAGFHARRWVSAAALTAVGLGLPALVGAMLLTRELHLVNGLSRPVRVCVDGRCQQLEPGQVVRDSPLSLPGMRQVESSWPGAPEPFETVVLPDWKRAVYLVLGAAPASASPSVGSSSAAPRPLAGTDFLADEEVLEVRGGGWRAAFQEHADEGRWPRAGALAEAVALADPTALEARELAARARLREKDAPAAARFGEQLVSRYPDDLAAHRLHQDLLLAAGRAQDARQRYAGLTASNPQSVELALLHARLAEPEEREAAVEAVRARFPTAPAPLRELARVRFAKGPPDAAQALPLLDEARQRAPESL